VILLACGGVSIPIAISLADPLGQPHEAMTVVTVVADLCSEGVVRNDLELPVE